MPTRKPTLPNEEGQLKETPDEKGKGGCTEGPKRNRKFVVIWRWWFMVLTAAIAVIIVVGLASEYTSRKSR